MDRLSNEELILIMLSMKKQYEEQYKIMEDKYNSLSKYCKSGREDQKHILTNVKRHLLLWGGVGGVMIFVVIVMIILMILV